MTGGRVLLAGATLLATVAVAETADAQRPQRPGARAQAQAQAQRRLQDSGEGANRAQLETAIRRSFARVARRQVGLSDTQMRGLVPITQRHERQRRILQKEEGDTRMALRALMRDERTADPARVDQLRQRLLDVQRRRLALAENEQRELGTIMTPMQVVKYLAVQEQFRRRFEELRQRRNPIPEGDTPLDTSARRPPPF